MTATRLPQTKFAVAISRMPWRRLIRQCGAHNIDVNCEVNMILHKFNWKKEVIGSDEPVLVDFWASWCGPCKTMNPALESLARDFKVCKVNVDTNQQLAAAYHIESIPALFIFKDGKIASRHVGVVSEKTLRTDLERLKTPAGKQ